MSSPDKSVNDVEDFHNYYDDEGAVDVDEDDYQEGLMEGLKSWLGFAGSMTGTGTTAISGKTHHKDDNSDYVEYVDHVDCIDC